MALAIGVPTIKLGELQTSSEGQKSIPVCYASDQGDRVFTFPGQQDVPFNPCAYQEPDASRLSLCFSQTDVLNR